MVPRMMTPEAIFREFSWKNPQETVHFWPESAGKHEELDARIRQPDTVAAFGRNRLNPITGSVTG